MVLRRVVLRHIRGTIPTPGRSQTSRAKPWRARCADRTPGPASGTGKRTGSNTSTAPHADSTTGWSSADGRYRWDRGSSAPGTGISSLPARPANRFAGATAPRDHPHTPTVTQPGMAEAGTGEPGTATVDRSFGNRTLPLLATRDHDALARPGRGPRTPGRPQPPASPRPGQASPGKLGPGLISPPTRPGMAASPDSRPGTAGRAHRRLLRARAAGPATPAAAAGPDRLRILPAGGPPSYRDPWPASPPAAPSARQRVRGLHRGRDPSLGPSPTRAVEGHI
jgi:hypothetical protein